MVVLVLVVGYLLLPLGINNFKNKSGSVVINWFRATSGSKYKTVTFPIATYSYSIGSALNTTSTSSVSCINTNTFESTSFKFLVMHDTGSSNSIVSDITCRFIVIGRG